MILIGNYYYLFLTEVMISLPFYPRMMG